MGLNLTYNDGQTPLDEENGEFLLLHQSQEEIDKIIDDVKNGNSEEN